MDTNLSGYIFDAKTAKPLGKVDGNGTTIEHKFDALNVTVADLKPKVETVREVRIDYDERLGDAGKSLSIETFMTAKELRKLVRELMGGGRMNREQAEHILEAYINLETVGGDNRARAALREVVLDAMTEYRSKPAATLPNIAVPPATPYNVIATSANTDGSTKATCVGLDPLFRTCTAVVER